MISLRVVRDLLPTLLILLAAIILISGGVYVPGQNQAEISASSTDLDDLRKLVRLGNRSNCTASGYSNTATSKAENSVVLTLEIEWRTLGQEPVDKGLFTIEIPPMSETPLNFEPPTGTLEKVITSCGLDIVSIDIP